MLESSIFVFKILKILSPVFRQKEIFFLSDSTTRPSDMPLNVIVESGNTQAKVVLQMHRRATTPLLGRNGNRPRYLSLTLMLNPFFFQKTGLFFENLDSCLDPCQFIFISTPT